MVKQSSCHIATTELCVTFFGECVLDVYCSPDYANIVPNASLPRHTNIPDCVSLCNTWVYSSVKFHFYCYINTDNSEVDKVGRVV